MLELQPCTTVLHSTYTTSTSQFHSTTLYNCRLTQLINLCIGPEGPYLEKFLGRISFAHPHAIFLTLRTHYNCLRLEFTEKSMQYTCFSIL